MPVFLLNEDIVFPNPNLAVEDGLLAIEGDLSTERLLLAYSSGIFPWFSEGDPIMWWSPNPRMVLFPEKFKISKSFRQVLKNKEFEIKFDHNFEDVIRNCSVIERGDQDGTWITNEMKEACIRLHQQGFAHSVETYMDGNLVGGLYGVSLGKAFFGESMFYTERDASKIALYFLVMKIKQWDFMFIDAQVETSHLKSLGAENIPRTDFLKLLKEALKYPMVKGKW